MKQKNKMEARIREAEQEEREGAWVLEHHGCDTSPDG